MDRALEKQHTATAVITHHVVATHVADYERWLDEIVPVANSYPGHMGVVIIRPVAGASDIYTIVINFDSRAHLRFWMASNDRARLIAKAQPWLVEGEKLVVRREHDLWFTPQPARLAAPKRWKQFLLSWSAIYPLVLGVSLLMGLLAQHFGMLDNYLLRVLLTTFVVVLLMVYVVMPRYTRLVHGWLFR